MSDHDGRWSSTAITPNEYSLCIAGRVRGSLRIRGLRCPLTVVIPPDLRAAVWELRTPCTWRRERLSASCSDRQSWAGQGCRFVGRSACRTIWLAGPATGPRFAGRARSLRGSASKRSPHDCGPASVVGVIDHPEMTGVCERMVQRLRLWALWVSATRAWLPEMNPRSRGPAILLSRTERISRQLSVRR